MNAANPIRDVADPVAPSVSRRVAVALTCLFIGTVVSEGAVQHVASAAAAWQTVPTAYRLEWLLPDRTSAGVRILPLQRDMHEYEESLESDSALSGWLLPRVQRALTGWLGYGNEQAYVAGGGRLFYRIDVDAATGRGFLEERELARRTRFGNAWEPAPSPDPVAPMLAFQRQLDRRGIRLVVMPTPSKVSIHPEWLAGSAFHASKPVANPSYAAFVRELEAAGIAVFDPSDALWRARGADSQYLMTDTHWTPSAMETVARSLANSLSLPPAPGAGYVRREQSVSNLGDTAVMLKLPGEQRLYAPETVSILPVVTQDGTPWRPDESADVLLLGDSFSNIYSLDGMGWGTGAGFAEQLSYALQRPIDRIVINSGGAFSTRQQLAQDLARGVDRLAGKRVVIYQFAARELSAGDWKPIDLPTIRRPSPPVVQRESSTPEPSAPESPTAPSDIGSQPPTPDTTPTGDTRLLVTGIVVESTSPPKPGSVPYRDAIIAVRIESPSSGGADEIVVYVWGMQGNQAQPASRLRVGSRASFRLEPWSSAMDRYGSYNRIELESDDALFLDAYWGELMEEAQ
ncbi:hypothetical protein FJZ36_12230 [Candidatus Poribacteria bacterium]|nr:hypothetical protein [Candidatus Poribacteria bacterium]